MTKPKHYCKKPAKASNTHDIVYPMTNNTNSPTKLSSAFSNNSQ